MSRPGAARLAWSLGTLSVLLVVASRLLEHLNRGWPVRPASGLEFLADAATLLFWSLITAVGALIAARQPANPIGGDLAIIASTLAGAALFQPLRGQIQDVVDRRFYRAKYQAQHTLEGFSATLRQQIDLDSLNTELVAVVSRTMQPALVSLWQRRSGRPEQ